MLMNLKQRGKKLQLIQVYFTGESVGYIETTTRA